MFDFSFDWMQTLSMLGRVALAAVLAGVIGYEREHVQRNAGMRTHILVAIGASLWMEFATTFGFINDFAA